MESKVLGYKIRNKETGLYALSIYKNKWGKSGRTWSRMCDVVRVLNLGSKSFSESKSSAYKEWLIGNIEIIELTEFNSYSLIYIINKLK